MHFALVVVPIIYMIIPSVHALSFEDGRYRDDKRFLFEEHIPGQGPEDLECVTDAVNTAPLSMPYYSFFYGRDIKIIPDIAENTGLILFSTRLTDEADILPSGGYSSPVLFVKSIIKKMCPHVRLVTGYDRDPPRNHLDYIIFRTGLP